MEHIVNELRRIPGVSAVTLGGSRATKTHRADSDWDFGLYYRGSIDVDAIRRLGHAGTVVEAGSWGRLVNGGAWLEIDGQRVDLLYRDLDVVSHWLREAQRGRYERDHVEGYIAGMTTYVLVGEMALSRVLHGSLPRPAFPEALRQNAPPAWYSSAHFSLGLAQAALSRGDRITTIGLSVKCAIALAQGLLAARGEWALNEKRIVERAGIDVDPKQLGEAAAIDQLHRAIASAREAAASRHSPASSEAGS